MSKGIHSHCAYLYTAMVIVTLITSGCEARSKLAERRHNALSFNNEELSRNTNSIRRKWSQDIINALESSKQRDLKKATIASASIIYRKNGTASLFVFWIEDTSSIDKIELTLKNGSQSVYTIPLEQIRGNLKASAETVVFGAEIALTPRTSERAILAASEVSNAQVGLLNRNERVGETAPLSVFVDDAWVIAR